MTTVRLATILPPAVTQLCDANGDPLANGQVYFYIPNTTTFKTTWQDSQEVTPNTNPVILNAAGEAIIYGNGQYLMVVYDQFGNLQWSGITSWTLPDSTSSDYAWYGTSTGTKNAQILVGGDPSIVSLNPGDAIAWLVGAGLTNSGPLTITINGGAAISVVKASQNGPVQLDGGEACAGDIVFGIFDGTYLQFEGCLNGTDSVPYLGTTGGTANAQTVGGPINGFGVGRVVLIQAGLTNTGPMTLNLNVISPFNLKKDSGGGKIPLSAADFATGSFYLMTWDGVDLILLNPSNSGPFSPVGVNTLLTSTNFGQLVEATAAITITLPQIATLWNGFTVGIFAKGGNVTLTPNATDSINGGSAGSPITVSQNSIIWYKADGGTSWWGVASNSSATKFISAGNSWALSSTVQLAHGLGGTPTFNDAYLVCVSTEGNYSVGSMIKIGDDDVSIFSTSTNVGVVFDGTGPGFVDLSAHTQFLPTPAKWHLTLVASL